MSASFLHPLALLIYWTKKSQKDVEILGLGIRTQSNYILKFRWWGGCRDRTKAKPFVPLIKLLVTAMQKVLDCLPALRV